MFFSTTTLVLATFYLPRLSLSRPLPKPQEVEPKGLEIGPNVGCGDNALGVDINSKHLPLIPCTKTEKLLPTTGAKLPFIGSSHDFKRANPMLFLRSISGQGFVSIPTSNLNTPLTAIDSSIPRWASASTSTSRSTIKEASTRSKTPSKTHKHHRTSLSPNPPPTIIIDPIRTSTKLARSTHTHHRILKTPKASKTSRSIQDSSVHLHPHPLPVQTLDERWGKKTKPSAIKNKDLKSTNSHLTWISPPQTRFPITPVGSISVIKGTPLKTKASAGTSRKRATWHPPAETLYPPPTEPGLPNKA